MNIRELIAKNFLVAIATVVIMLLLIRGGAGDRPFMVNVLAFIAGTALGFIGGVLSHRLGRALPFLYSGIASRLNLQNSEWFWQLGPALIGILLGGCLGGGIIIKAFQ